MQLLCSLSERDIGGGGAEGRGGEGRKRERGRYTRKQSTTCTAHLLRAPAEGAISVLSPPISEDINLERELHIVAGVTTSFPIQLLAAAECF